MDEIWDLIESVSEGFPTYSYGSSTLTRVCLIRTIPAKLNEMNGIVRIYKNYNISRG